MPRKKIEYEINKNACHVCISHAKNRNGYPRTKRNKEETSLHRFIYEDKFGLLPQDIYVLHKCDNRACINIEHLFPGTHADNMRDKADKNRCNLTSNNSGINNGRCKLTENDVLEIFNSGLPNKDLAKLYNIGITAILCIKKKKSWKTLLGDIK